MGNQGTASGAFRRSVELVQAGVLGEVREVIAWNDGGGRGDLKPPTAGEPAPDWLKWDLWLGPAASRPFHRDWLKWHTWRDFATGNLGNWAPHTLNLPFKALRIDSLWYADELAPAKRTVRVEAEVSGLCEHSFPRWELVRYDVPARGDMPPVRIHWCNGAYIVEKTEMGRRLEKLLNRKLDRTNDDGDGWDDWAGILLVGSDAMLHSIAHNTTLTLLPQEKFKNFDGPPEALPRTRGHQSEWLDACRGGPPAMSNFDYSGPLAEFCLLGNVATLVKGPLEYDPVTMKVTNDAAADALLRSEYRRGWSL
jgi:hypothetical protein